MTALYVSGTNEIDRTRMGRRVAAARKSRGFTQAELGRRVGVVKTTVCGWETERTMPHVGTLLALAIVLRRATDFLLTGKPKRLSVWKMKR